MDTETTLSISEARKKIFKIADKARKFSTCYTLTEKGRPKVVVMSAEEFDSWQETLGVARDLPSLRKDIMKAEKEYREGKCLSLEDVLSKEGFVLADKSRN